MVKTKDTHMQGQNLHKNHFYKNFVLLLVIIIFYTEQTTNLLIVLINIIVEVYHKIVIQIETLDHKTDIALNLETDTVMKELLLPHSLTSQEMTIIDEFHALIVHHTHLPIDHHIDEIHALDINHVYI